jgi:hypothetical protein
MRNFTASNAPTRLGKIDRWIVWYLTFCAIMYGGAYIGTYCLHTNFGVQTATVLIASVLVIKAATIPATHGGYSGRATVILSILFAAALFNSLVSWNTIETSERWVLWFGIIICFARVVGASDGTWVEATIQRLPYLFATLYVTVLILTRYAEADVVRLAYHLSGLYGNLIFASGLFATRFWQRMFWSSTGLVAIFFSGAGGALFTIPIMFIPYILYSASSMPVKGIAVAGFLIFGGLFFYNSNLFGQFLDIKLNANVDTTAFSGMERLERSKDERLELVQYGFALAQTNPLGTGLGHTYKDIIAQEMGVAHVHNGTMTLLIELGFPGLAVVAALLLWVFWCILRSNTIPNPIKGFYFTFFFTVFGRSLSENYTPFDLGNFFNLVFLIFTAYFFLYQRQSWVYAASGAAFRLRPMMPPPPGMRLPPPQGMRPRPQPISIR